MNNTWMLIRRLYGDSVSLHRRFFTIMGGILILSIVSAALNYWGLKGLNILIGIAFAFAISFVATHPKHVLIIAGIGIIDRPLHPVQETKEILDLFGKLVGYLLAYFSVFFLIMGTISIDRNYFNFFVFLLAAWSIWWMSVSWGIKAVLYRKILITYAIIVLVISVLSLLPADAWMKTIGFDPFNVLAILEPEKIVYEIERIEEEQFEMKVERRLDKIRKKIENREILTEEDKKFLENWKKKTREGSAIGVMKKGVSGAVSFTQNISIFKEKEKEGKKTKELEKIYYPGQVYSFELKKGQWTEHWIKFPQGKIRYSVNSGDGKDNFSIMYKDGEIASPGTGESLPKKKRVIMKILSHQDQKIYLSLRET